MSRKQKYLNRLPFLTVKQTTGVGILLLFIVMIVAGHLEAMSTKKLAESTMNTLKQQCVNFDKVIAADRTKSLFRMTDMMLDLSYHLAEQNIVINDEYLEKYVDSMRLTGIALLDENLLLEASGYTRKFQNPDWKFSDEGSRYADIITYPDKIYAERLEIDGEYYDIAAVSRRDASGILIGFYRQPSGLISGTENNLESLLTGVHLENSGHYIVSEDGIVRVASDQILQDKRISGSSFLKNLSKVPKDGSLHMFYAKGKHYWGYRSGCENYSICIYYPVVSVFSSYVTAGATFAAIYFVLCCLYYAVRTRTLYENQEKLQESNQHLTETVEMLRALETIYFTLFYVDLEKNQYKTIYITPWLKDEIPLNGVYTELKQTFIDHMIVPEYRRKIDERMSIEFIQETLNRKNITDVRKSFYTDYQAIRGDQTKWCRVSSTVVDYDCNGKPIHVLALLQDVDKEKAKEAEYEEKILREAYSAKIANNAKTEFLRRISHDIRTPINGILGYVGLAENHPEDSELQEHCRENIMTSLHTLMELVNGILEMSELESNEIVLEEKPFDLNELLNEINAIMEPQAAERNIYYEVLRKESLSIHYLIGSPRHVSQILMNLVSNAVKYGKTGGYIRLNTHLVSQNEDQVTYEFICEDNGIGMSEEFQKHLFEPFMQESKGARTVYEGSGLGLSIVKKLVEVMGGNIVCQSEKNVGTRFLVQLTFRIDKMKYAQENTQNENEGYNKLLEGKNVLIVEDNELNMEIAEYFLTEHGASVSKAWNGQEGVEAFTASEYGFFDLIIMDIMMPVLDGYGATKAIRRLERPDAKTVLITAMSANAFENDIRQSMEAGMNGHIAKPVEEKQLLEVLSKLLKK